MSIAGLAFAAISDLTGCATIRVAQARSTEALLGEAGFEQRRIDAAEIDRVDRTPPEGCRCV